MGIKMKHKSEFLRMIMAFFVCTSCITILEGVIGMLFFPQITFGYEAFFSPPLFGLFSVLFSVVNYSKKELSIRQALFRKLIHLLMIEGLVFGVNYMAGTLIAHSLYFFILAVSIALIFILVHVILWLGERRSAIQFNEQLKIYQSRQN